MRLLASTTAIVLLLTGCDDLPGRPDPAKRYQRPDEITDFGVLYAANCSACHGAAGRRGAARPLDDPIYLALVSRERVRDVVAHGVSGTAMPGFSRQVGGWLTDPQIEILAAGVFTAWRPPAEISAADLPPYDEAASLRAGFQPGDPARGGAVYGEFCARCHGDDGRGGPDGGSIVDPNFLALVSEQMLRNSITAGRPDLGMPDWRGASHTRPIPPQDIADLVAWLESMRRAPGESTAAGGMMPPAEPQ